MLGAPITMEDLTETLQGAKKHKSLVLDGLLAEVYFHYSDALLPPLLQAFSAVEEEGCPPDCMHTFCLLMHVRLLIVWSGPNSGRSRLILAWVTGL